MSTFPSSIGNYFLESKLGSGMTSEVWLGRHRMLDNRRAAIKILKSTDSESIERFQREARIASRLDHDHIVGILDHGYQGAFHYTVMEHIPGTSLQENLRTKRPLATDQAFRIFHAVGSALDYAHQRGVIHRDVSPNNILLEPGSDRILLIDFGLARDAVETTHTSPSQRVGTLGYYSPEHTTSLKRVTRLSDIFCLGIVFYQMLTGDLPWRSKPQMPGDFVPPLLLKDRGVTTMPVEFDEFFRSILAVDPKKRFPSATAAAAEIRRIYESEAQTQPFGSTKAAAWHDNKSRDHASPNLPVVRSWSMKPNPVETYLAGDLIKEPLHESRAQFRDLEDPKTLASLLDRWGQEGFLRGAMRRKMLGRLAVVRRMRSTNLYFYKLRVQYEERADPVVVEAPHDGRIRSAIEPELDRWDITLPPIQEFEEQSGEIHPMPGSTRALECSVCHGERMIRCHRCHGTKWIRVDQPAKQDGPASTPDLPWPIGSTTVPCPDCDGRGGSECTHCKGIGRMVQYRKMQWRRWSAASDAHDDLPPVNPNWLLRTCGRKVVYREVYSGGSRPDWAKIPKLSELLSQARLSGGKNSRIILSEVTISCLPVTEIAFDIGDTAERASASSKGTTSRLGSLTTQHLWYICGYEQQMPRDWRFLNRDRMLLLLFAFALTATVAMILQTSW